MRSKGFNVPCDSRRQARWSLSGYLVERSDPRRIYCIKEIIYTLPDHWVNLDVRLLESNSATRSGGLLVV